ncbi:NAD(P)-binding protein [Mycena venus]|uniref:NAD(P)-binding protein n=1 Tax=Mycena venus TaxID=2733690 RepID=A0A8H6YT21_9AGAR|nr:NAD(P)-binding protein [Mycena venus]
MVNPPTALNILKQLTNYVTLALGKDEWVVKEIRLGLNCVSGPDTTSMARLLGQDAYLVSYGAMWKQPLSLPTLLFIFENLTSVGFWQSRWYKTHMQDDKEKLMQTFVDLVAQGKHWSTRFSPSQHKIQIR